MAYPSPVVMISIIAIAMAAIAFVVTRNPAPTEKVVQPVAKTAPATHKPAAHTGKKAPHAKPVHHAPAVHRAAVPVEVYNNSQVTGLAATVGTRAAHAGWDVVGADNWYGTIPSTTVYFPPRLRAAGKQLALDLGIRRTEPAVDPMKADRLTVILTGPLT